MSRSSGTGCPLILRCSKCKKHRDWRRNEYPRLEATGRTKVRGKVRCPSRKADVKVEYRCLDCGHVGWSNHSDAGRLLKSSKK